MGLDAKDGALRWVRSFRDDVIAGSAAEAGFALCDTSGAVHVVAASNGGDAGGVSLGQKLRSCVVQSGALRVGVGADPGSLVKQIGNALDVRDQELATAQHFLLIELGPMQDPTVTKILIDLASDARISPLLLEDAAKLLATRRNGAEYMIEALGRHYDFLSDVLRPPPIGPMADALAAMHEKRAAPQLAKHLNDPANAPDDIRRCARALVELAGPAEAEDLKTFFALYRATADEPALVEAVLAAAEALLRIGGDSAREVVTAAIADPLTQPEIKRGLENLTQTRGAESPRSAPIKG
jgi:outer membrane protein assembly factor BamB